MAKDKEKNLLYINHSGELLIWLLVLLVFAMMFFFSRIGVIHNENEYDIFMPDVDGLIVGSPVRVMGVEVGHITKIKPIKDELFVCFVITDETVKIPQGTQVTVEFNGMAGSKSLELYVPDKNTYVDSSVPLISVNPPKRLSDATGLLNEMFKKIGNIISVSSRFGAKLSEIDFPEAGKELKDPKEFLKYADNIIDIQQKRVDDLGRKLDAKQKQESDNSF